MNKIINKLKCNNRLKHQESYSPVPYIKKGKGTKDETRGDGSKDAQA